MRYIYALILFLMGALPASSKISGSARLSVLDSMVKSHYNPFLGAVAMDLGLCYNLRFFGNYQAGEALKTITLPGVDGAGTAEAAENLRYSVRSYPNDHSEDPHWTVIKFLFPSSNGAFGPSSNGKLNFAHALQKLDIGEQINVFVTLLTFVYKGYAHGVPSEAEVFDGMKHIFAGKSFRDFRRRTLKGFVKAFIGALKEEIEGDMEHAFYPIGSLEQFLNAFFFEFYNTEEELNLYIKEATKRLEPLREENRYKDTPLYSPHFNKLYRLVADKQLQMPFPYNSAVPLISNGRAYIYDPATGELDRGVFYADCVETAARHILNLLFFDPKSRTFNKEVIRNNPELLEFYEVQVPDKASDGSSDIRSQWGRVVQNLNHSSVSSSRGASSGREGTARETNIQSGAGRSGSHSVAQEAHTGEGPEVTHSIRPIHYVKSFEGVEYEIKSGFINLLAVFQKLFNLPLPKEPLEIQSRESWVKEAYGSLFTYLNPRYHYELKDSLTFNEDLNDFTGRMTVKAIDEDVPVFSFDIVFGVDSGKVENLKSLKGEPHELSFNPSLKEMEALAGTLSSLGKFTAAAGLIPLLHNNGVISEQGKNLYSFFGAPLTSDGAALKALELVFAKIRSIALGGDSFHLEKYQAVFRNIQKNAVEDEFVLNRQANTIGVLLFHSENRGKIERIIEYHGPQNILLLTVNDLFFLPYINQFSNLNYLRIAIDPHKAKPAKSSSERKEDLMAYPSTLDLSYFQYLRTLKLEGKPKVVERTGPDGNVEIYTTTVYKDSFEEYLPIEKIIFSERNTNLETLSLAGVNIREFVGLENLLRVKEIEFQNLPLLNFLTLSPRLMRLVRVTLDLVDLYELEGVDKLKGLETLGITEAPHLSKISFSKVNENLSLLVFVEMAHLTLVEGVGVLPNLHMAAFIDCPLLKGVTVSPLNEKLGLINKSKSPGLIIHGLEDMGHSVEIEEFEDDEEA